MEQKSDAALRISYEEFVALLTNKPQEQNENNGYLLYHTTYEAVIDSALCVGTIKSVNIREGISFQVLDVMFHQETLVDMESTHPQVGFAFFLEGETVAHIHEINDKDKGPYAAHFKKHTVAVYANCYSKGPQQYFAKRKVRAVYIHFNYETFGELLSAPDVVVPSGLQEALSDNTKSYLQISPIGKSMLATCFELVDNPFRGKSREFFTEAKVFELIAKQLDILAKRELAQQQNPLVLTESEKERIADGFRILEQQMANPPSLLELAKTVGLSVYRLKVGLKIQYGDTPYKLLLEMRMQRARLLLERGELSVQQVAAEVGYMSLGSFSNSFTEHFGLRPSAVKTNKD